MDFHRTKDYDAVRKILTLPQIYPTIGDDYAGPAADFRANDDPRIWYVMVRNGDFRKVGMFTLLPQNRVCWEVHVVMLPTATTSEKWAAARQLVPWVRRETDCVRLTGAVPESNKPAIVYGIHGIGMTYVGRHPKAFAKHGELQDLILMGIAVNGG